MKNKACGLQNSRTLDASCLLDTTPLLVSLPLLPLFFLPTASVSLLPPGLTSPPVIVIIYSGRFFFLLLHHLAGQLHTLGFPGNPLREL